jgi:serine/threonine-protein kinase SRPK3
MGESLSLFKSRMPDHKLPLYIMKRVSRQLLQAVDFTHACGFAHTGIYLAQGTCSSLILFPNMSLRNILCELDETVIADYLKAIPKPHVLAKAPPNRPIPLTGMRAPVDVRNLNIRLADFGQAVSPSDRTKDHQGDRTMWAPEVVMGLPWDSKVDIWNVACLVSRPTLFIRELRCVYSLTQDTDLGGLREPLFL